MLDRWLVLEMEQFQEPIVSQMDKVNVQIEGNIKFIGILAYPHATYQIIHFLINVHSQLTTTTPCKQFLFTGGLLFTY